MRNAQAHSSWKLSPREKTNLLCWSFWRNAREHTNPRKFHRVHCRGHIHEILVLLNERILCHAQTVHTHFTLDPPVWSFSETYQDGNLFQDIIYWTISFVLWSHRNVKPPTQNLIDLLSIKQWHQSSKSFQIPR